MTIRLSKSAETSAQEQEQEKAKAKRTMTKLLLLACGILGFLGAQFSTTQDLPAYPFREDSEDVPMVRRSVPANATSKPIKTVQLVHVMNIYATHRENNTDDIIHQPYDQWVTLQSIERAKQFMPPDLNMTLVCAILESDMKVLTAERVPQCDRRILLERSTVTEYGWQSLKGKQADTMDNKVADFFEQKELPFMQDVLDAAISVAREHRSQNENETTEEDFYVMLTNADIGFTKHFYSFLLKKLKQKRQAFTINRMTIPMSENDHVDTPEQMKHKKTNQHLLRLEAEPVNITIREPTTNQTAIDTLLEQIEAAMPSGIEHPGTDLFVMHSSIVDKIYLGDQFPGFSPVAGSLKVILRDILAKGTYVNIPSNLQGSFHMGDERHWNKPVPPETVKLFKHIAKTHDKHIKSCPLARPSKNPHTFMNLAKCGEAFGGHYADFLRQYKNKRCPYTSLLGWMKSDDSACEAFRKGKGPYPWKKQGGIRNSPK